MNIFIEFIYNKKDNIEKNINFLIIIIYIFSLVSIVAIKVTKTSSHFHNNIFNLNIIDKYNNIEYIFLIIKKIH